MPPKQTKRKRQLMEEAKKGREARKKLRLSMMSTSSSTATETHTTAAGPGGTTSSLAGITGALDPLGLGGSSGSSPAVASSSSSFRPTPANPTGSAKPQEILKTFSEQWKLTLDQEDLKSLALFLCHVFTSELDMSHSRAAEHTAKIIGKTDRTIRQWRCGFFVCFCNSVRHCCWSGLCVAAAIGEWPLWRGSLYLLRAWLECYHNDVP